MGLQNHSAVFGYENLMKFTDKLFPNWRTWIYKNIPDTRSPNMIFFEMGPVFILGILMFVFKVPSLRAFEKEFRNNAIAESNFSKFFTLVGVPSDDGFRYILKTIPTESINRLLAYFHKLLERKKILNLQKIFGTYELLSLDGSGIFSSYKNQCEKCLSRVTDGVNLNLHGALVAALTNLSADYSLTLQFEPIQNNDPASEYASKYSKNDCEINAAKRLLKKIASLFPRRKFCIIADNLLACESIVKQIISLHMKFILTAKETKNKELFSWYRTTFKNFRKTIEHFDTTGNRHVYRWCNNLPLTHKHKHTEHVKVNLLEYWEYNEQGEPLYYSSWITNFHLDKDTVRIIAKGGRARFNIENKTFNEQKNLGFNIEHNFGHEGNLVNVFFGLAQIAHLFTTLFSLWKTGKATIAKTGSTRRFFEKIGHAVTLAVLPDQGIKILKLQFEFNTS